MDRLGSPAVVALIRLALAALPACRQSSVTSADKVAAADTGFASMQARGERAMGVDQYTSTHQFDALPDGGRIALERDADDAAGIAQIRRHLQAIAQAFDAGEFRTPALVHAQPVPGTSVMAAKRDVMTYTYRELPRGGEVRIVTQDPQALRAVQEFMSFQREKHHAGGIDHGHHGDAPHGDHDHNGGDHGQHDHGASHHE
jgi:hypothetical protein